VPVLVCAWKRTRNGVNHVSECCSEAVTNRRPGISNTAIVGAHSVQVRGKSVANSALVTERSTFSLGKP